MFFYLIIAITNAISCFSLVSAALHSDNSDFATTAYIIATLNAIFAVFFTVKAAIYKPKNDE